MGSSTVVGLVWLVFLVAPGLLFDLLRERRLPTVQESAFRESSRVVLSGVLFNVAAFLALSMVATGVGFRLPNGRLWFANPHPYVSSNFNLVVRFVLLQLVLSLTFAIVTHVILMLAATTRIRAVTGWHQAIRTDAPPGSTPGARIKLDDGTVYVGTVGAFTTGDVTPNEREIVLRSPVWVQPSNRDELRPVPREWQEIILSGSRIKSIAVVYWRADGSGGGDIPFIRKIGTWLGRWI
jgi:hypothetical protein